MKVTAVGVEKIIRVWVCCNASAATLPSLQLGGISSALQMQMVTYPRLVRHRHLCTCARLHRYIKQLMRDAGLSIREDAMGNIFGRLEGSDPEAGKADAEVVLICLNCIKQWTDRLQVKSHRQ